MKKYFNRYKYTHEIFYSKMEVTMIEMTNDSLLIIESPKFPKLNGKYIILEIIRKNSKRITVCAQKIGMLNEIYFDVYHDMSRFSIFDEELVGVIFKN
jgi:hypothetical protein